MKASLVTFCFLIAGFSSTALAQTPGGEPVQKSEKKVLTDSQGRRITNIDFDDAAIEGRAKAPEGFVLQSRNGASFRNILDLRRNFRGLIQNSAPVGQMAAPQGL